MLDDRGQTVRVLNPAGFNSWPVQGDARIAALVSRIGLAMRGGGLGNGVWMLVQGAITIALAVAMLLVAQRFAPGIPGWLMFGAIGLASVVAGRLVVQARTRANEIAIAEVIAAEGLCPSCGYNLHGLTPENDTCYVCPECSAAWLERRVVRTVAFAAGTREGDAVASIRTGASSGGSWTTLDDRGRRVELVHPRLRKPLAACPTADVEQRLRTARAAFTHDSRWVCRPLLVILWPLALGVFGLYTAMVIGGSTSAGSILVGGIIIVVGAIIATIGNFAYSPKKVRLRMLELGLCPSCGADLADGVFDAEGYCVCHGCTSAWLILPPSADRVSACGPEASTPAAPETRNHA